jgi:hypothetical protein
MPTDQRRNVRERGHLPNPDDTDAIVELSLKLAKAARRQLPWHCREDED